MNEALEYIYYIFDSMFDWLFNDAELFENVSLGWIIVVILLFTMVIKSVLNIPRSNGGAILHHERDKAEDR